MSASPRFPLFSSEEVGSRLLALGRHEEFLDYLRASGGPETSLSRFYAAVAMLSAGQVAAAESAAATIDWPGIDPRKGENFREALRERKSGQFPLVRDSAGKALAVYSTSNSDLIPLEDSTAALIDRGAGPFTFEAHLAQLGTAFTIETTIDPRVQRAAAAAIAEFRASLVAIDLQTNSIVAVANSDGDGPATNLAFTAKYEPGSVIKVVTLVNAIDHGVDLNRMFPMPCRGFLEASNRLFYDWAPHGDLSDANEAMAVSCNVAFGRMGIDLGGARLQEVMRTAGFGQSADLQAFTVPLGANRGPLTTDYDVASYAVGLEQATISPLHIAMLGAAFANEGMMRDPILVASRRSVVGDVVGSSARVTAERRIASPEAARRAVESMRAVVEHEMGTGRRASVQGLPIAMKTGTAGDSRNGFDSVIMAFAPADKPRIVIGMIAEDAGPAEFAGARIARDFFTAVRPILGL